MAIHLLFLESRSGEIALPPDAETAYLTLKDPRWQGWELREANSLSEVDRLQKRLQQAEYDRLQQEGERDLRVWQSRIDSVRSNLSQRAASSATSEYERDFIREWIKLRDEKRREDYKKRYEVDMAAYSFFEQREFDKPRNAEEVLKESL